MSDQTAELRRLVEAAGAWQQRIDLGDGVVTIPGDEPIYHEREWALLAPALSLDGARVLDVGTNAGYFALQCKRAGAARVLGLEPVPHSYRQALLCRDALGLNIEYRHQDASVIAALEETFDLVIFTGILYHLKNPLGVLEDVGRVCRDAIVVETECLLDDATTHVVLHDYETQAAPTRAVRLVCRTGLMKFIEGAELNNDATNWWVPDIECVSGMLRTAGFRYLSSPVRLAPNRVLVAATKLPRSVIELAALG